MTEQSRTHDIWDSRFLNQVITAIADGVFTLDTKGRLTSWNQAMERITGISSSDAIGKTCAILNFNRCFGRKCPADLEACGILKNGISEARECHLLHKNGHEVSVIKNANVVRNGDGKAIGIVETITDLTELNKARRRAEDATRRLQEMHRLGNIIGKSSNMQQVYAAIKAAASSAATILIQGESGTGKELVAGAIHYNGELAEKPLVTVNCSALSESLLESELFGHVKGAFTGAIRDRMGRFEEANNGTIFLDEIGELSPFIQVKLLRVLQEREIERVGESVRRKVNIRVIAATNKDIYALVRRGDFREDLYYRLKVFPIHIPPLRERKEDIPLLVSHFIDIHNRETGKQIRRTASDAMRIIMDYHWPGNVRELENAVEHAFVLCDRDEIAAGDLPVEVREKGYHPAQALDEPVTRERTRRREKLSRESLLELLDACDWNKAEVGRRAGLSRTAIWKYMKKWEIPLNRVLPR